MKVSIISVISQYISIQISLDPIYNTEIYFAWLRHIENLVENNDFQLYYIKIL